MWNGQEKKSSCTCSGRTVFFYHKIRLKPIHVSSPYDISLSFFCMSIPLLIKMKNSLQGYKWLWKALWKLSDPKVSPKYNHFPDLKWMALAIKTNKTIFVLLHQTFIFDFTYPACKLNGRQPDLPHKSCIWACGREIKPCETKMFSVHAP